MSEQKPRFEDFAEVTGPAVLETPDEFMEKYTRRARQFAELLARSERRARRRRALFALAILALALAPLVIFVWAILTKETGM